MNIVETIRYSLDQEPSVGAVRRTASYHKREPNMPNLDENLAFAPATELRDLIADKQITSTELTELYLSRIEALDDQAALVHHCDT